jgi:hypothetical protein
MTSNGFKMPVSPLHAMSLALELTRTSDFKEKSQSWSDRPFGYSFAALG